jgi:integrase
MRTVDWTRRFILFNGKRHPLDMGEAEVEAFLSHLATDRRVAAATQNQAKSALLFLYEEALRLQLPWLDEVVGAKDNRRLPVVLTPGEVRALLNEPGGTAWLVASLLYGTGMRLMEGLRLRVKDIDFERRELVVRDGKGAKDRVTVLPENVVLPLCAQLVRAKAQHAADLREGFGAVWLPHALERKYPQAPRRWAWAMGLPGHVPRHRPAHGHRAPPPPQRSLRPEGRRHRRAPRRHRQALLAPRAAPLLRHSHAASRVRHPHRAGAPGPQRREDHDDLHARPQPRRPRRAQPPRPDLIDPSTGRSTDRRPRYAYDGTSSQYAPGR